MSEPRKRGRPALGHQLRDGSVQPLDGEPREAPCRACGGKRYLPARACRAICHAIPRCRRGDHRAVYERGLCYRHYQEQAR